MGGIFGDIKIAIRQAVRSPGLVLLITIIPGLGVGANTVRVSPGAGSGIGLRNNHTERLMIAGRDNPADANEDWAVDLAISLL
jgi:hypothetical protein